MLKTMKKLYHDEGATAVVEWSLLGTLIALVAVVPLLALGTPIKAVWTGIKTALQ